MNNIEKIQNFLAAALYEQEKGDVPGKDRNPFITISRETGAGGHSLSTALLKEMKNQESPLFRDWQILDHQLCMLVAQEPGLKVSVQQLMASEYHSEIADMISELVSGSSPQFAVVRKMSEMIRTLASAGKVIIIGRAGACVTRDLSSGIHLRLVASMPTRIKRMRQLLNADEKNAREYIFEQDKGRQALVRNFFNRDISDPLLYDMVFNTDRIGVHDIARTVVGLLMEKRQPANQ